MANKAECVLSYTIFVAFVVLLSSFKSKTQSNRETDALLKWKISLPNQSILDSWVSPLQANSTNNNTPSPCKWFGITCNKEQRVTDINLAYTGLRGTLKHLDFSSFPNLLRLDLKMNNLVGSISENIGILSNLQFLDLSTNSLNGSLPLSLANLSKVYELDVSRNNITGLLDPLLFPDGTNDKSIPGLLSLKNLLLQDTLIGGRVPKEIGNLKFLSLLALDGNSFFGSIPQSFGNLSELTILRLGNNQLSGQIPENIGLLTKLSDFRVIGNKLSGIVPQELGNLSSLTVLHLAENNFSGQLPPQVCKGGKLVNFSAAFNNFNGPIPLSLKNCKALYRVRLEHNQLTGYLDKDFGVYPNLTYIDLSFNKLQGELSPNWGKCQKLMLLGLAENMISGKIPEQIVGLRQLVKLDLSSNILSGEVPIHIGNLSQLSSLVLKGNKLSGKIALSFGRLFNLESLDLSKNMFVGKIPYQIESCTKLRVLSLNNNQLKGTIPYQIGKLVALQELDLSFNSLGGNIPPQLGSLMSLEKLNLSHNNLNGTIPDTISDMVSLTNINLSYNYLEGLVADSKVFQSAHSGSFSNNKALCGNIKGLQPCRVKSGHKKRSKIVIIIVVSLVGVSLASFICVAVMVFRWKKKSKMLLNKKFPSNEENPFSMWYFKGKIAYEDIVQATKNFDDMYCIGMGGSGKVYKLEIPGFDIFAIKKLNMQVKDESEKENLKSFANEAKALTAIKHRNIVKLYGYCCQGMNTYLVYEFMERGSLADILRNDKDAEELNWIKRFGIVKGVAYALSYMHHDCDPPLIHRDISSKNVLLDSELEAHVSDFGTAKFLNPLSSNWTVVAGTYGYLAPGTLLFICLCIQFVYDFDSKKKRLLNQT